MKEVRGEQLEAEMMAELDCKSARIGEALKSMPGEKVDIS